MQDVVGNQHASGYSGYTAVLAPDRFGKSNRAFQFEDNNTIQVLVFPNQVVDTL